MEKSTAQDGVSRDPLEAGTKEGDEVSRQAATVAKAVVRLNDITEYLSLIDRAVASVLPEVIANHPLGDAVDNVSDLDGAITAAEKALSELKGRISYSKEVSMPARMDAEKAKTFNTEKYRVTRTARVFASILSDQISAAYDWLRRNQYDALIKETVNSSSLSAAAKELMEAGRELPEDMFRVHMKDGISITKKK
jgi:hypothetical protein